MPFIPPLLNRHHLNRHQEAPLEPPRVFTVRDIPPNAIFLVLTNCQGEWPNQGFGAFLRGHFPAAYGRYRAICQEHSSLSNQPKKDLVGTCQIIPPLSADIVGHSVPRVYIACLFVSFGDGHRNWFSPEKPGRDGKAKVLAQTDSALAHLKKLLIEEGKKHSEGTLYDTNWTESGKNMTMISEDNNAKDFQMNHKEVEALIYKNFAGWGGEVLLWDEARVDPNTPFESVLSSLDPKSKMI
ncbi:hypothetical protein F4776DRAFT_674455 [Hypoxylon sp. NC0597]|nr:hypothetical protein F4776DRAFT_674455 [Hypoxylon sp. NC0597]